MSFTQYDPSDFVVSSDFVVAPAWTNNSPTLTTFFTSSATSPAPTFYSDVYSSNPQTVSSASVQFSLSYGHTSGSGSLWFNPAVAGMSPTRTTFGQYRNEIYGSTTLGFNFGGLVTASTDVWVISINRDNYKESLFAGTFNLKLTGPTGTSIFLTDNSNDTQVDNYLDCGRAFDIVSGSNGYATTSTPLSGTTPGYTASGSYGLFLPDIGTIVLNPRALQLAGNLGGIAMSPTVTSNVANTNPLTLYRAINSGSSFQLNSQQTISSNYIFTRVKNAEYNYTSNPSFVSGSGELRFSNMLYSPQTYITTVGMYNSNSELLAVAKLTRPLAKDFTKELLVRVKLDW